MKPLSFMCFVNFSSYPEETGERTPSFGAESQQLRFCFLPPSPHATTILPSSLQRGDSRGMTAEG